MASPEIVGVFRKRYGHLQVWGIFHVHAHQNKCGGHPHPSSRRLVLIRKRPQLLRETPILSTVQLVYLSMRCELERHWPWNAGLHGASMPRRRRGSSWCRTSTSPRTAEATSTSRKISPTRSKALGTQHPSHPKHRSDSAAFHHMYEPATGRCVYGCTAEADCILWVKLVLPLSRPCCCHYNYCIPSSHIVTTVFYACVLDGARIWLTIARRV